MKNPTRKIKIHNVEGTVKRTGKTVVLVLKPDKNTILELHFGDPDQLMDFAILMIGEMAQVFPEHEASRLWMDDNF